MQGPQHRADLRHAADLILASRTPGTTVFRAPEEGLGFDLMAILLPRAFGPAPDPAVRAASPAVLAALLPDHRPAWLATAPETWEGYRTALPPPDCLLRQERLVLAYWGDNPPPACP